MKEEISNLKAMRLVFIFFKSNISLSLITILILMIFMMMVNLLNMGLIAMFGYIILNLAIQIYIGRAILENNDEVSIKYLASKTNISSFLTKYLNIATGSFLGFFTIIITILFIFSIIVATNLDPTTVDILNQKGVSQESIKALESDRAFQVATLVYSLISLTLSYAFPAVMGRVFSSQSFISAFKRVFLIFSPSLWKSLFSKEYFILILIWSIVISFAFIIIAQLFIYTITIPIALLLLYLISLYNAIIYAYSIIITKRDER